MNDQVVRRPIEHHVSFHQQLLDAPGEVFENVRGGVLERRFVTLRKNPGFEWESGRVGREGHEVVILGNDSNGIFEFLTDDVAEDTSLFVDVVLFGAFQLLDNVLGKNGQRNQLRVRVLQRSTGGLPVILKDKDVFETLVLTKIDDTVAKSPEHVFDALFRQGG